MKYIINLRSKSSAKKVTSVPKDVKSDLGALGYYYDKTVENLKNSSPLSILNTKNRVQISTVDQTFVNLEKSKLKLKLDPKELADKLDSLPGVTCYYYTRAPKKRLY